MSLTLAQRLDRLNARVLELPMWRERETVPVDGWTFDGQAIALGAAWPKVGGPVRFEASAEVPGNWPLEHTRLRLDVGGESLVSLTYAGEEAVRFGLDPYHREFPVRARRIAIETETTPRLPFGEPVRNPHLNEARLILIEPDLEDLNLLVQQIIETVEILGDHEVVPHLLTAAETALRSLHWPSSTEDYIARTAPLPQQQKIWQLPPLTDKPAALNQAERASVASARDALVADLTALKERFPPRGEVLLTGHAHIDLAWLWPYSETRRKVRRTFHTALSLMDKSPDFRFNQSTAAYYAQLEEDDPALLEEVKTRVKAGTWETIGGMWVEPDTNMPTGESLARQILYGQRYFEKTFGVRHTVCWLPDCFGFSGALPQLLVQGGIDNFFTIKVNWSETNKFPHDLFWWEGLDGSRVLAHTFENPIQGYNGIVRPSSYASTWKNFRGKVNHPQTLLAVGYGDGGGGVTPEMVAREKQLRDFPALPQARWGRVDEFYARAQATAEQRKLPVWSGEIYLELHRATLTTQSHVKRSHRHAERALITAEIVGSLAALLGGAVPESIEPLWRTVLKNEFHDILPGSGIHEINVEAREELEAATDAAKAVEKRALEAIAAQLPKGNVTDALVVVNPSLSPRPVRVTLADGALLATDDIVPPLGVAVFDHHHTAPSAGLIVKADRLENAHIAATIGPDGTVTSLVHKATGREALSDRGNQLWVYAQDKPRSWDAWDIDEDYVESGTELTEVESIEVTEAGPHLGAIKVVKRFRNSRITQTYSLAANGKRLDIETRTDWHDRRAFLRSLTPAALRADYATFECAYGVVRRSTHTNTSWDEARFEVPAHRFADLSEPDFGVAVLNNAKYGHSVRGNVLGLSLMRSPIYPDPLADEGEQVFTYSLLPHEGDWATGGVREEADDLNQPLLVTGATGLATGTVTPVGVDGITAALSGIKPAEDGKGLVLRVYEPRGARGAFGFSLPQGWRNGGAVTLLEEKQERSASADLMPFEVRSWLLVKGS
ncbi:MAG TPA: glycoside hydrolase family 38 C-terminal domain-containing protein [Devosiaceae bacterium]|jgi:alpha-mannosidase